MLRGAHERRLRQSSANRFRRSGPGGGIEIREVAVDVRRFSSPRSRLERKDRARLQIRTWMDLDWRCGIVLEAAHGGDRSWFATHCTDRLRCGRAAGAPRRKRPRGCRRWQRVSREGGGRGRRRSAAGDLGRAGKARQRCRCSGCWGQAPAAAATTRLETACR